MRFRGKIRNWMIKTSSTGIQSLCADNMNVVGDMIRRCCFSLAAAWIANHMITAAIVLLHERTDQYNL
jgi:hypothetical protein